MSGTSLRETADRWLMKTANRYPVSFVRGAGSYLYDETGKEYLDFFAGIAVTALGHSHPRVSEAVAKQSAGLVHVSNHFYTRPQAELAERLCELLGWTDARVFFTNSGAESNECAIKLVRKWSRAKYSPQRYETIAAHGSFHGRTFETLAATGQPAKWAPFTPLPPGFVHVPYDDDGALEHAVGDRTSSVLLEPVLGEGGVWVPASDYLPRVRTICDSHDLAFVADEVQTGFGRTGKWFGFQHAGGSAVPDVISLAKALGNGLPIGACVARGEFADVFAPGDHGTTFGGGPVACAAALATLEVIEQEGLIERASHLGGVMNRLLLEIAGAHPVVTGIRGIGLLLAVQLSEDKARAVVSEALAAGLVTNDVTPSAIRICPALIVSEEECVKAAAILDQALTRVEGKT